MHVYTQASMVCHWEWKLLLKMYFYWHGFVVWSFLAITIQHCVCSYSFCLLCLLIANISGHQSISASTDSHCQYCALSVWVPCLQEWWVRPRPDLCSMRPRPVQCSMRPRPSIPVVVVMWLVCCSCVVLAHSTIGLATTAFPKLWLHHTVQFRSCGVI